MLLWREALLGWITQTFAALSKYETYSIAASRTAELLSFASDITFLNCVRNRLIIIRFLIVRLPACLILFNDALLLAILFLH